MKFALLLLTAAAIYSQSVDLSPRKPSTFALGGEPSATTWAGREIVITSTTAGSCTVAGSSRTLCFAVSGAWEPLGGAASTLQFQASISSPTTTLAITAGYSSIDSVVTTTAASTGVLSGSTASSTVYGYIDGLTGAPTLGHNGAATLSSAAWTIATGITDFPVNSQPKFVATYVSNAFTGVTNYTPMSPSTVVIAGTGISLTRNAGGQWVITNTLNGTRSFGGTFVSSDGVTALTSGATSYFTVPFACTIAAWNIVANAGTATVDIWKVATGTAIPTNANSITASATPALATGTAIHSTTLTSWTTSVAANDIIGIALEAVATATFVNLTVECNQ